MIAQSVNHVSLDIESARNLTGQSRSLNGSSFLTQTVGAARSRPKLTQLSSSLNVERLRRSGRLRASPTRRMRSSGCFLKSGVAGGCYPPLRFRLMGCSVGAAEPPCGLLKTGGNYLFCEFLKHFFVGNRENKKMVVSSIKMM